MLVGEVIQSQVRPNGLRNIDHHVAAALPRSEQANLGIALRMNRALKKSQPRMPATRIRQQSDRSVDIGNPRRAGSDRGCLRRRAPLLHRRRNHLIPQPRGSTDLGGREPVETNHVLQPVGLIDRPLRRPHGRGLRFRDDRAAPNQRQHQGKPAKPRADSQRIHVGDNLSIDQTPLARQPECLATGRRSPHGAA